MSVETADTGVVLERARSAVTQRNRSTIARLSEISPPLGSHLRASVRTGSFCVYDPPAGVEWRIRRARTD